MTTHLRAICDALTRLMPGRIEVVLHDLTTQKIAYVAGGFSNRNVGDDSLLDDEHPQLGRFDAGVVGPYSKRNWDGQRLRSISIYVPADGSKPLTLMCINLLVGDLERAADFLHTLVQSAIDPDARPLIQGDWREQSNNIISRALSDRGVVLTQMRRQDRIAVLLELDKAGILRIRGAAAYLIKTLGISRASYYQSLRLIRSTEAARDQ